MIGYVSNGMGELSPPNAEPRKNTCQGCGDEFIVYKNEKLCSACETDLLLREQLLELLTVIVERGDDKYKDTLIACQNDIKLLS